MKQQYEYYNTMLYELQSDAVCDVISTRRTEETWEGDCGDPTRAVEERRETAPRESV